MNKKLILILVVSLLGNIYNGYSQENVHQTLKVGDKVPDFSITIFKNGEKRHTRLSEFKGKLIILDLWSVTCSTCIALMPEMIHLQEQFKNEVQIVSVTQDDSSTVNKLWLTLKRYSIRAAEITYAYRNLSTVVSDTIINNMFPHVGVPTHIWIDSNLTYKAVTYPSTTTVQNIKSFLRGEKVFLAEQKLIHVDETKPLTWLNGENGSKNLKSYSLFFNRIENDHAVPVYSVVRDLTTNKAKGISVLNASILQLFEKAYFPKPVSYPDSRVILEVKSPEKFYWPPYSSKWNFWLDSNTYCYAVKVSDDDSSDAFTLMKQDLDRFFHLKSSIQTRTVRCVVLKRISNDDKLFTEKRLNRETGIYAESGKLKFIFNNGTLGGLFNDLRAAVYQQNRFLPFFNETNYFGRINVELPWKEEGMTVSELRASLLNYGLDIVEEQRKLEMLIIKDEP